GPGEERVFGIRLPLAEEPATPRPRRCAERNTGPRSQNRLASRMTLPRGSLLAASGSHLTQTRAGPHSLRSPPALHAVTVSSRWKAESSLRRAIAFPRRAWRRFLPTSPHPGLRGKTQIGGRGLPTPPLALRRVNSRTGEYIIEGPISALRGA